MRSGARSRAAIIVVLAFLFCFCASRWSLLLDKLAFGVLRSNQTRSGNRRPIEERRAEPFSPKTPTECLLWTLGCELWTVGDEMLIASGSLSRGELGGPGWGRHSLPIASVGSLGGVPVGGFTSHLPTVLANSGAAMKGAADALLDGRWTNAWQQLEDASSCCREYLPASSFEGLLDFVFCHAEPVPSYNRGGAASAGASLRQLAQGMDVALGRVGENSELQYPFRERAEMVLENAAGLLREAGDLFEAGSYYMPRDPRGARVAAEQDVHGFYEDDEYGDEEYDEDEYIGKAYDGEEHDGDGEQGGYVEARLAEIKELLERANSQGPLARKRLLRRLVRESHPDQNPGRELQVLPVFNYVLRMLRLSDVHTSLRQQV